MSPQSTAHSPQHVLEEKQKRVESILEGYERVIVAFSGGVDSTLLVKLARDVLGKESVLAVTADSPSLSRLDLEAAVQLAVVLDLHHLVIHTHEVEQSSYRANTPARCYVCKQELFHALQDLADARKIPVVLYGAIGDDRLDERPGQRAAMERDVRAPLQEAGLDKREVRALAKALRLPNWDRPQNACLSSRVPHGLDVTEAKLSAIERAETVLIELGFRQVRVRHFGAHARIEVGREEVNRFHDSSIRQRITEQLTGLGFQSIGIDRHGYRSGGANRQPDDELKLV